METDEHTELRQKLCEVLVSHGLGEEGGFLKGFALMAEWVGHDGRRWLTCSAGDGVGEGIPDWQVQGYFHNFNMAEWPDADDDDD